MRAWQSPLLGRLVLVRLLLGGLVLAGLAACGSGDTPEIRVAIETLAGDGAPPEPLWLVPVESDTTRTRIPLQRRGQGPGDMPLYVAAAAAGSYEVVNEQGWRMLTTGQTLPWFHADAAGSPNVVALARPYTLYLRARAADSWKVAPRVAIEQRIDGDPHTWRRLDVPLQEQGGGWVSLRLPPDVAVPGARFRVFAFMEGDIPARMTSLTIPSDPAMPYVRLLETEVGSPLLVRVVGGSVADGTTIEARLPQHPLDPRWTARIVGGNAWFAHLGDHVEGAELRLASWGEDAVWTLDAELWEREGTLVILALPGVDGVRRVRLPVPEGVSVRRVLLRPPGATEQGAVPFVTTTSGIEAIVPEGALTGWVELSTGLASLDVAADDGRAVLGESGAPARITGNVAVSAPGFRVVAERQDGPAWITGAGLDVVVQPGGRYALAVPPGRYRLRVRRPDLRLGEPTPIPVELRPGTSFSGFDLVGR